jgi:hypothetical protein
VNERSFCQTCGEEFVSGARFCRRCGSPRAELPQARPPSHDSPTEAHIGQQPVAGYDPTSQVASPQQPPRYSPPPAYQSQPGYLPSPDYPAPPGYPTAAVGHPGQQPYVPVPIEAERESEGPSGWLVGGILAVVLVVAGIGVGVYLAASGTSGSQARLLTAPAVTTAFSVGAAQEPTPRSHSTHSTPSLPHPTSTPVVHEVTRPAVAHTAIADSTEKQAVANTIQHHFSLISQHDFSAAYALLAPSLQSGESSWVASHRADGIYKVDVAVDATLNSADSATATVSRMTTLDAHGCKNWSGSWGLSRISGQWRISEAHVTATPC